MKTCPRDEPRLTPLNMYVTERDLAWSRKGAVCGESVQRRYDTACSVVATMELELGDETSMQWLFTMFPTALSYPKVDTWMAFRAKNPRASARHWFNETHSKTPDDLPGQQLPVLLPWWALLEGREIEDVEQCQRQHMREVDALNQQQFELFPCGANEDGEQDFREYEEHRETSPEMAFWLANEPLAQSVYDAMPVLLPELLRLKVGMPVLLLFALGHVPAGSLGTVVAFEGGRLPEVLFVFDSESHLLTVERVTQVVRLPFAGADLCLKETQLPLYPAYCLSSALLSAVPLRFHAITPPTEDGNATTLTHFAQTCLAGDVHIVSD